MNKVDVKNIISQVQNCDKLVVYGAGFWAKKVQTAFLKYNIKVDYFVVSNEQENNQKEIRGIPVYEFGDCEHEIKNMKAMLIIAVGDNYEAEIRDSLEKAKIDNYVCLSDLICKDIQEMECGTVVNEEDLFLQNIAEWYVLSQKNGIDELELVINQLRTTIEMPEIEKRRNEVAFVVMYPMPRLVKIAKALYESGVNITIFLCSDMIDLGGYADEVKQYSSFCFECFSEEELYYQLIYCKASIVHLFSPWGYPELSYSIIKYKKFFPKIVFETTDILAGMIANIDEKWIEAERFCLENADGVCCRGYELEYLKEHLGYKIHNSITFMDYCKNDMVVTPHKKEAELSLCYAGGFVYDEEALVATKSIFREVAVKCAENKCHLHIYPRDWNDEAYSEFIKLDHNCDYFHFHHPVPYTNLCSVLSQYDYSICPARKNFLDKEIAGCHTRNKYIYASTNQFFDALDAGIPIIASTPTIFLKAFEQEGVVLKRTIEEYNFDEMREMKKKLQRNCQSAHDKFAIKNNIDKLIKFYRTIIN